MAVDHLQSITALEGQLAGEQLVQGDAQRVEIGAIIDRAVHTARLFRRDVGQGADQRIVRRQG